MGKKRKANVLKNPRLERIKRQRLEKQWEKEQKEEEKQERIQAAEEKER